MFNRNNDIYSSNRGPGVTLKPTGEGVIWGHNGKIYQSEDIMPNLGSHGNGGPCPGLPVKKTLEDHPIGVAIEMGCIVAVDPETKFFVPANGGEDITITYNPMDVQYGVLNKDCTARVKDKETRVFKANVPQGWVMGHVPQHSLCYNGHKILPEQEHIAFMKQGQIRMAVVYKTDDSKYDLKIGDYVKGDGAPDTTENPMATWGFPVRWEEGTDKLCQRAGKVTYVEDLDEFDTRGTEVYSGNMYGAYMHGAGTKGLPMEIYNMLGQDEIINDSTYKKKIITISIIRG